MRIIELSKGKVALVSDRDFKDLSRFKWFAVKKTQKFYAVRNRLVSAGEAPGMEYMHRRILGNPETDVDHRDGDGLNNQRRNLRRATHRQNLCAHRTKGPQATSSFRGVSWITSKKKWRAQISSLEINKHLGYFPDEVSAALAYDVAAKQHFGKFAHLNFI